MPNLTNLKNAVETFVDDANTRVEGVHKNIVESIKNLVPDQLQNKEVQDIHEKTFGVVYESIRHINRQVGEFAGGLFSK